MALQDILQKILDEAANEVKKIDDELAEEKKQLKAEFDEQTAKSLEALSEKKAEALASLERKTNAMARRDSKSQLQQARRNIISRAMSDFHERLVTLPDVEYQKVIEILLDHLSGDGTLFVPKTRVELTKKVAPKGFAVEASDNIAGGFVAKLSNAEVDCSFHSLVFSEYSNEIESFFAQKLNLI